MEEGVRVEAKKKNKKDVKLKKSQSSKTENKDKQEIIDGEHSTTLKVNPFLWTKKKSKSESVLTEPSSSSNKFSSLATSSESVESQDDKGDEQGEENQSDTETTHTSTQHSEGEEDEGSNGNKSDHNADNNEEKSDSETHSEDDASQEDGSVSNSSIPKKLPAPSPSPELEEGANFTLTQQQQMGQKPIPVVLGRNMSLACMVTINEGTKKFFESLKQPIETTQLNTKDAEGNTPLHWACLLGQVIMARLLIRRGARVNASNNKGATPLHYAACKLSPSHTLCAELLILHGAKVNPKNKLNETPLHYAVTKSKTMRSGNVGCIHLLCRWRADPTMKDSNHRTPLHYAAQYGQIQVCNMLIERGGRALVNTKDANDYTPLHLAIMYGRFECVQLFLLRGANITSVTKDGSTVLHLACKFGRPRTLDLLLNEIEKNPKFFSLIRNKDKRGFTCIHWAAITGDLACLSLFPEFLDIKDNAGLTPVFWAALKGHRNCVQYFLSKGVDLTHPHFDTNLGSTVTFPLAKDFSTMIGSKEFSDITIKVEGKPIPGHKVLISRCLGKYMKTPNGLPSRNTSNNNLNQLLTPGSPTPNLRDSEDSNNNNNSPPTPVSPIQRIKIKNLATSTFMDFCTYIYAGKIPSDEAQIKELLKVANAYGLPILQQICENALIKRSGALGYLSTIPLHLASVLDKSLYCDCVIVVENKAFKLHKFVLSSRCAYFKQLFEDHSNEETITLDSTQFAKDVFINVVDYLYTDTLRRVDTLLPTELKSVYECALILGLKALQKKCEYYLVEKINDETVSSIFLLTENTEMVTLRKACMDYIANDLKQFTKSGSLENLGVDQLAELKKRQKESKKEKTTEEKEMKKAEKNAKKLQKLKDTVVLGLHSNLPPTPQTFFYKRNLTKTADIHRQQLNPCLTLPLATPVPSPPTSPKPIARRNSSKW